MVYRLASSELSLSDQPISPGGIDPVTVESIVSPPNFPEYFSYLADRDAKQIIITQR